jgi:hypothetical protein
VVAVAAAAAAVVAVAALQTVCLDNELQLILWRFDAVCKIITAHSKIGNSKLLTLAELNKA